MSYLSFPASLSWPWQYSFLWHRTSRILSYYDLFLQVLLSSCLTLSNSLSPFDGLYIFLLASVSIPFTTHFTYSLLLTYFSLFLCSPILSHSISIPFLGLHMLFLLPVSIPISLPVFSPSDLLFPPLLPYYCVSSHFLSIALIYTYSFSYLSPFPS